MVDTTGQFIPGPKGGEQVSARIREQLVQRLPRVMLGRVLLISILLGATLVYQWFSIGDGPLLKILFPTYGTISFVYAVTVVWALLFRHWEDSPGRLELLAVLQVVIDLGTIAFLVAVSGGPTSIFSFLFIVVVIYSGFILGNRWAFWSAGLGSLAHAAAVFLLYFYPGAILRETRGLFFDAPTLAECFYSVFIQTNSLILAGALTSYIAEKLQSTGELLEQSEVDFRELEQLHRRIVGNLTSGLITTDSRGRILYANPSAGALLGGNPEEFAGKPFPEVVPEFSGVVQRNPGGVERLEIERISDSGIRYFGLTVTPLRDESGRPKGNIFIFQDLTELKHAEEKLKKADRLAAVGELAAGIAHEIRNPLASISGCVQMLKDDLPPDVSSARLFRIVVHEIERLNTLITEFLQYARPKQLEPGPIDVRLWIEDMAIQFRASAADSSRLVIEVASDVGEIAADRALVTQAVWNLIRNADQALGNSPGGRIRVGASVDTADGRQWLKIVVADNGPGIPDASRARIFEPFFTTKVEGTGLGLSLVFKIIEMHGGSIDFVSRAGETEFTLRIPCRQNQAEVIRENSTERQQVV